MVLNGLGYMLFGIPEKDLDKTWTTCKTLATSSGDSPLLHERDIKRIEVREQRYPSNYAWISKLNVTLPSSFSNAKLKQIHTGHICKKTWFVLQENNIFEKDITKRRFSNVKLYTGGRILHITRCKFDKSEARRFANNSIFFDYLYIHIYF